MKKFLFILLVLSWVFFLFFFEKQGTQPIQPIEKPLIDNNPSGVTLSGATTISRVTSKTSDIVRKILEDSEVKNTLSRIESDRPKYRQDGTIFMNRERLLPGKERGYYHEWTVVTPGSLDRGARRIIEGKRGEIYFTEDHYQSFIQVK